MTEGIKYISDFMNKYPNDRNKAVDEYLKPFTNKEGKVSETIKSIAESYRQPAQEKNRTLTPTKVRREKATSKITQENRNKRREKIDELRRTKSKQQPPSFTESQEEALDFFQKESAPTTPSKQKIAEMPSNSPFWDINAHRLSKADKKTFEQIMGPSGNIVADKYSSNVLSPYSSPDKLKELYDTVVSNSPDFDLGLEFNEEISDRGKGVSKRKTRKSRGKRVIKGKSKTKRRRSSSRRK
jgi:hypothetical protein